MLDTLSLQMKYFEVSVRMYLKVINQTTHNNAHLVLSRTLLNLRKKPRGLYIHEQLMLYE